MKIHSEVLDQTKSPGLIFTKDHSSVIPTSFNIGFELANELKDLEAGSKVPLIANTKLHELVEKSVTKDDKLGDIYSIKNIGILFEPELKIDFVSLCRKYSRDSFFIIEHTGDIDNNYLYFLTRDAGIKVDLTDLNYTVL